MGETLQPVCLKQTSKQTNRNHCFAVTPRFGVYKWSPELGSYEERGKRFLEGWSVSPAGLLMGAGQWSAATGWGSALFGRVAKSPDKLLESSMLHSGAGKLFCGDIYLLRHILICGEEKSYK